MRRHTSTDPLGWIEGQAYSLSFARRLWQRDPAGAVCPQPKWMERRLDEQLDYVTACMAAARDASAARVIRERRAEFNRELAAFGLRVRRMGTVTRDEGESGTAYVWFENTPALRDMSDRDLILALGWHRYYGGVGRPFTAEPWVRRRTRRGALVTQFFALDI